MRTITKGAIGNKKFSNLEEFLDYINDGAVLLCVYDENGSVVFDDIYFGYNIDEMDSVLNCKIDYIEEKIIDGEEMPKMIVHLKK